MTPDDVVAALLRGDDPGARALEQQGAASLLAAAAAHDVIPLVAERLAATSGLPADFGATFEAEAHRSTAADLAREAELRRLLAALAQADVEALLVKGSHLAYTHYPRPDLRSRIDTDVLIARDSLDRADSVLTQQLGYTATAKPSGELTATQRLYVLTRNGADVHLVDLHWRLASPQLFAHVLSFDDLRARAVPLPALGSAARGPSNVDALLIACMHRVAHHHDEDEQFKWLYDIHVVASRLTDVEWDRFVERAVARGIAAVSLESLERSRSWFHTAVPERIRMDARLASAAAREGTAAYLTVRPKAHEVLDDLRALPSWRDRLRLAREHLLPDSTYMRTVYAPGSAAPLPVLYAWRIVKGAGRWLRMR